MMDYLHFALILLLAIIPIGLSLPAQLNRELSCEPRPLEEQEQIWLQYHQNLHVHESFLLLQKFKDYFANKINESAGDEEYIDGKRNLCHSAIHPEAPLREKSNCPWYEIRNVDIHRFPREMIEARCSKCDRTDIEILFNDGCRNPDGTISSTSRCQPVFHNVLVLREKEPEDPSQTKCDYAEFFQQLSVGCTCTRVAEAPGPDK